MIPPPRHSKTRASKSAQQRAVAVPWVRTDFSVTTRSCTFWPGESAFSKADLSCGDAFDIVRYPSPEDRTGEFTANVDPLAVLTDGVRKLEYDHALVPDPDPVLPAAFDLPEPAPVQLEVFDVSGRRVWSRRDTGDWPAGRHEVPWLGQDSSGRDLASGTFLLRVVAGDWQDACRLVLVR